MKLAPAVSLPLLALATLLPVACGRSGSSVARALAWLEREQGDDGLWRSTHHEPLQHGESTTAALVLAMLHVPTVERAHSQPMIDRALAALQRRSAPSPVVPPQLVDFPMYTAAHRLHALVWMQRGDWRAQVDELIDLLRRRQLVEAQGWSPEMPEYGGFGLGDREPRHPEGDDLVGLSATAAVLEALAAAKVPADDPMVRAARTFVERCQHFDGNGEGDGSANGDGDGGFCFTPTRDYRAAKAGFVAVRDGAEEPRSYGTATADGVRALLASGYRADAPRVRAALAWLEQHAATAVPGLEHAPDAELEPSLRLYWFASLAAVGRAVPQHPCAPEWCMLAARGAGAQQRADGSFAGLGPAMKEDDPLVATALALWALAPPPVFR